MHHDLSGDRVTVANEAARLAWNDTLEAVLAHAAAAPEHLARTLQADPDFALAHANVQILLRRVAQMHVLHILHHLVDVATLMRSGDGFRVASCANRMVADVARPRPAASAI